MVREFMELRKEGFKISIKDYINLKVLEENTTALNDIFVNSIIKKYFSKGEDVKLFEVE